MLKLRLYASAVLEARHLRGLVFPKDRLKLEDSAMDRDDGVELLDDYSISALASRAVSGCAVDQPIGNLVDTRDVLQLSVPRLIDFGQHSLCRASERDRALEITTPPMFDSGVDLPHRRIVATSFNVVRAADLPVPCTGCRAIIEGDVP